MHVMWANLNLCGLDHPGFLLLPLVTDCKNANYMHGRVVTFYSSISSQ